MEEHYIKPDIFSIIMAKLATELATSRFRYTVANIGKVCGNWRKENIITTLIVDDSAILRL